MIAPTEIAAVLLVGGMSRRMGRDKAFLPSPRGKDEEPLWITQLKKLRGLKPSEVVLSKRPGQEIEGSHIVVDPEPGLGPLSALAAVFTSTNQPYLLPLAVDMPGITIPFLEQLVTAADERGLVFKHGERFEPFPALYPRTLAPLIDERLAAGERSMQGFITQAIERGLLQSRPLPETDSALFKNLNTPEDLEG